MLFLVQKPKGDNINFAIILAGGKGKRVGAEKNKCLLKIAGKEIILWTLEVFEKCKSVNGILCVLANEKEVKEFNEIIKKQNFNKIKKVIPTKGKQRQDGALAGLKALKDLKVKADDIIMFHNGANPLVKEEEIISGIKTAKEFGASVLATPVKDTIKIVDEKNLLVIKTLKRSELWAMQTPQNMKYSIALQAYENAVKQGFYGTDDVQLVERIGKKVKIVKCSYENFKITTQEDLPIAERIIKHRITFHETK